MEIIDRFCKNIDELKVIMEEMSTIDESKMTDEDKSLLSDKVVELEIFLDTLF